MSNWTDSSKYSKDIHSFFSLTQPKPKTNIFLYLKTRSSGPFKQAIQYHKHIHKQTRISQQCTRQTGESSKEFHDTITRCGEAMEENVT